jgi:uncharacterized membrane protein YraQ (UPF0718 family)
VAKGAHFVAAVAFMFASTNLVIELGILILIFLGWQFLAAELLGGIVLITISSTLIRVTYPRRWLEAAREKVEQEAGSEEEDFDWKQRIRSWHGWCQVGNQFVMEWRMVWQEILIGFTIAGFVAVFVPDAFWKTLFLNSHVQEGSPNFLIALENALIAPFVAACTFIGSMGNIPLATVLNSGGVLFAGIMGFIYSDLMVPPLVKVNAKYYGWRVALYIAGIMYVSIVITALLLHFGFYFAGLTPESSRSVEHATQFAVDYTFFLNVAGIALTVLMVYFARTHQKHQAGGEHGHHNHHDHGGDQGERRTLDVQTMATYIFIIILIVGIGIHFTVG